ncbi:methionyl-tRNA formyltransferase [Arthrobacter crusticola]|uniref:Methionyl-tRNA formyltransferase n=1 Tax=Arthrobacter crusticola TaxID=2547960 RepID=A0A4R5U2F4_9MICC|nr:methionyl-tRNA formyltransferase [Arthrobacter crusticola]TDK27839.1 methionyl-tRNA formyltransferase [Arthrobacter crusticola]
MRILFAGTPAVAVPSLNTLSDAGFEIAAVLTRVDAPVGRKRTLAPSPVAARAEELGLPLIKTNRFTDEVVEQLAALDLDAAAIVAYGGLVPPRALELPRHGWINLHFSLLPAWRGAAPVQHAVLSGDDITGASTFRLERGLDTGPVFGTVTEALAPSDTSGEVLDRLAGSGAVLLAQTLTALGQGAVEAVPQQGEVSLAPKLSIDDARIDWTQPAVAVRRRINAVTPEPGAWTLLAGQRVKIAPVRPASELRPARPDTGSGDPVDLAPGRVELRDGGVQVGTGSEPVVLGRLQPAGKTMMDARDWARGALARGELVFDV